MLHPASCWTNQKMLNSPFVSSDADGCWQWLPHCIHKLFKLSLGHQALLLVVVLKQFILLDNISIASSPSLKK